MNKTNPDYYMKDKKVSPIRLIKLLDLNFNVGNAVKYISRAGKKDGESYVDDLRKAETYLYFELDYIESSVDMREVDSAVYEAQTKDQKLGELLFDYIIDDWGLNNKYLNSALRNIFRSSQAGYYGEVFQLLKEAKMDLKNAIAEGVNNGQS